jgi:ectoine hydroxylase-related dioxygenase (phytanoyl-CoA dioxygenase family)
VLAEPPDLSQFRAFVQPLTSNGTPLDLSPKRLGRLQASSATTPIPEFREQFKAQGYIWLKHFFDRKDILEFREKFFSTFKDIGLLADGSKPVDGIYSGKDINPSLANRVLMEFVRTAAYESFCLHPKLWQFYDAFLEGPSYLHKRKIVRYTTPRNSRSTGAHYDLIYLRSGTEKVCSSWIPLGDIPVEMGGLVYLEGSDALGRKMEGDFSELNKDLTRSEQISAYNKNMGQGWLTKDLRTLAEKADGRWLIADYEAGDMVVHSSYMIHAATDNMDEHGRMRLSTDIRYQNVRDEIDARWQNHWSLEDML